MNSLALSALGQGLVIAVLALAFALVYWSTRIFFVALGALYALAPLAAAELAPRCGIAAAAAVSAVLVTALALLVGWLNHELLVRRGASHGVHFASSLALYLLVSELAALRWGPQMYPLAAFLPAPRLAAWAAARVPMPQILEIAVCLGLAAALCVGLQASGQGVRLRALADNPLELARSGYDTSRLRAAAFGVAGGAAGLAAIAFALDSGMGAHGGLAALTPAVTATLLTAHGRWRRLVVVALALSALRTAISFTLSSGWNDTITLAVLLLGLVGWREAERRWGREFAPRGEA